MTELTDTAVRLEGSCTVQAAQEMRERLLAGLAGGEPLCIDCSAVTEADLSLVQLLLAARRSAEQQGRSLSLTAGPSPALLAVLRQGGFLGETADGDSAFWSQTPPTTSILLQYTS